jgi:ribosomal protein L11 methyltransferase
LRASYLTVTCRLPAAAEDELAGALERWSVLGCQVENAGPEVAVTVFIDNAEAAAVPGVCEGLRALGAREVGTAHFAEEDWLAEYRRLAKPMPIGDTFWVDPHPGAATPPPADRVPLLIEPRQAFGSGSHESTRLLLLLLEELPVAGRRALDVGTGSGILALAAGALGASSVIAFDIDLDAVCVAHETAAVQRRRWPLVLFAGTTSAMRPRPLFDLVLANLIPTESRPLLADIRRLLAPEGLLVLSGLLADQRTAFEAELGEAGFAVRTRRELEEWVALVCEAGVRGAGFGVQNDKPAADRRA